MNNIKMAIKAIAITTFVVLQFVIVFGLYQIADNMPEVYECAACGAHVTEVWHTENANGEIVHICRRCADQID